MNERGQSDKDCYWRHPFIDGGAKEKRLLLVGSCVSSSSVPVAKSLALKTNKTSQRILVNHLRHIELFYYRGFQLYFKNLKAEVNRQKTGSITRY